MTKKIGLTMRVETASTGEIRDVLDSEWPVFIEAMGFDPVLLPHRMKVDDLNIDGLILTGGNDVLSRDQTYHEGRNMFETMLLENAKANKISVLGVCRGMQMINLFCGGSVSRIENHVANDHKVEFEGKEITVNSFHNDGISKDDLGANLQTLAYAADNSIEAFKHANLPWLGLMWHPERKIEDKAFHLSYIKDFFSQGDGT